jgi:hypothetical protein
MSDLDRMPPSTTTYVVATAIIAGITGYFIGQGASLGLFSKEKEGWPNSYNVKIHRGSSDEEDDDDEEEDSEEEGDGGELADFEGNTEEVKLVLVVRTDLGMTKGILLHSCSAVGNAFGDFRYRMKAKLSRYVQGKSLLSARMPHSPATNISSRTPPILRFCAGGNHKVKQRLRCRQSRKKNYNCYRRKP